MQIGMWITSMQIGICLEKLITRSQGFQFNVVLTGHMLLVFNPIMVNDYAAFFNCTPVGRASVSMMAPT